MTVPLGAYVAVSAVLFFIGCGGVLVRRNAVVILMCVELMLNAANLALVAFSRKYGSIDERGSVFVVFIFVVAAAEVAVGLAIVLSAYRNRPTVDVDEIRQMRG
jgi:NADH-quinone oxidoreductase subunit K